MKISVEITLIPIKKNYISIIKKFIKKIRGSDFKVIENPLSTHIYGDYDLLMNFLNKEIKNVFNDQDLESIINSTNIYYLQEFLHTKPFHDYRVLVIKNINQKKMFSMIRIML